MDLVIQRVDMWSCMEHEAAYQALTKLVAEPHEMAGVGAGNGGRRFHLDPDDFAVRELDDEIDLVPAVALPQVGETRCALRRGQFWPKLGEDEAVQ